MTLRRNADRCLVWGSNLHAIDPDVSDFVFWITADIEMPGPDVSASVNLTPPWHGKHCEVDSLGHNVLLKRRTRSQDRLDRSSKGALDCFCQGFERDPPILHPKGKRNRIAICHFIWQLP